MNKYIFFDTIAIISDAAEKIKVGVLGLGYTWKELKLELAIRKLELQRFKDLFM